jgi:predicted ATP-grasp superfamily ATP-dependent carboligase
MSNILLLGAGTQSLAIIPSLHRIGHKIYIMAADQTNYGDASKYVQKKEHFKFENEDEALYVILTYSKLNKIDTLIPMGDEWAAFVSKNKMLLSNYHCKMPDYEDFLKGYDKNKLLTLCEEKKYPHPKTLDLSIYSIHDDIVRNFPYPAMLKPNCTTGGRGMVLIEHYGELVEKYESLHTQYGDYHLQKFIEPGGRQVKVQLYIDENKQLVASSVQQKLRWYPNKGGSNCCAVSIDEPEVVSLCYCILQDINWLGFADFDLIGDPKTGELLIMEINPRLPACVKGSIVAGIDWGEIIVNGYLNRPQKQYEYKTGVYLRHLGLDILWFLHAEDKWHTHPNWFKFFGKNIYYQDMNGWSDPMPFIKGTWNNIIKLFNPEFRKAKGQK